MTLAYADDGWTLPYVQQRYEQFAKEHHGEIDIARLCEVMYCAGGRSAVQAMTEVSDISSWLARIESRVARLHQLLEDFSSDESCHGPDRMARDDHGRPAHAR